MIKINNEFDFKTLDNNYNIKIIFFNTIINILI